jgi:hypothetical protein
MSGDPRDALRHPMQPVGDDGTGVRRFKANRIVRDLLAYASARGLDLNDIAARDYRDEDRVQLAQLIGYSVAGFGDLSYVSNAAWERATEDEP